MLQDLVLCGVDVERVRTGAARDDGDFDASTKDDVALADGLATCGLTPFSKLGGGGVRDAAPACPTAATDQSSIAATEMRTDLAQRR